MNSLTKALNQIKKYCAKSTLPVLQNVLLELENGTLRMSVTNLESYASVEIPSVGKDLRITTNLKKLMAVVKSMSDPIRFEVESKEGLRYKRVYNPETDEMKDVAVDTSKLVVSNHNTRVILNTIDAREFPTRPDNGKLFGKIDLTGINRIYPFAVTERGKRPILECVLFQDNKMVAADGFVLAMTAVDMPETNLLIHADTLSKLPKNAVRANLFLGESTATFEFDTGLTLTATTVKGKFPDYQQVIPKHHNSEFTVNPKRWLKAVQGVKIFADDTNGIVRHSITGNTLTVSAKDEDGNVIQKELPANKTGVYPIFALGYNYLITTLKACVSDEIVVKLTMDEGEPGSLYEPTSKTVVFEDGNWMAMIMPMHIKRW